MCGRFAQVIVYKELKKLQDELKIISNSEQVEISFNVAPTHTVSAVVVKEGIRYLGSFRWGLIPSWMHELPAHAMINIRSETITQKPSFKVSFLRRRCIIPANGFYEWRKADKQPYFIHAVGEDLIYMAGIYDTWESPDGSYIPSLGIITTMANNVVGHIHDRMPLLLSPRTRNTWLNPSVQDISTLHPLLTPDNDIELEMYPVSPKVNSIRHNDAECMQRISNSEKQADIFG